MNLFSIIPSCEITFVCINNSVATKKGNSEGTTEFAQSVSPDFIAGKFDLENNKRHIVKIINIKGNKFLFIFIT
jgi:hypothetical protein